MSGAPTEQFNIHDAKTHLSRIIERVERGEEITISRAGTPVAKIIPLAPRKPRAGRGSLRGKLEPSESAVQVVAAATPAADDPLDRLGRIYPLWAAEKKVDVLVGDALDLRTVQRN